MASSKEVATVLVAATIAMTLFGPFSAMVADNSGTVSIEDESVTADTGSFVDLDGFNLDESTTTVEWYNETSSSWETVTEGTDYEMNYDAGEIKALEGGDINDGDDLRVTYDYQATDGTTTTIIELLPMFLALLILGVIAAKVADEM